MNFPIFAADSLSGKKVLIVGSGGRSGAGAAALCLRLGADTYLSDEKRECDPSELLQRLADQDYPDSGVEINVDAFIALDASRIHDLRPRSDAALVDEIKPDCIITAPGVPLSHPLFATARRFSIPIYGELDFAFALLQKNRPDAFIIAVTGTDGKSTTVALLTRLIRAAFSLPAVACGNYGLPPSLLFFSELSGQAFPILVVECSSFQLEPIKSFHPHIAMILNVARDHMDRYESERAYLETKCGIAAFMASQDLLLISQSVADRATYKAINKATDHPASAAGMQRTKMIGDIAEAEDNNGPLGIDLSALAVPGAHNRSNFLFTLHAIEEMCKRLHIEPDRDALLQAAATFKGLPHRLEFLGGRADLHYYNDSKATTVQAVSKALEACGEIHEHIFILCGGRDKGSDFSVWPQGHALHYFPFGEAASLIARALGVSDVYLDLDSAFAAAQSAAEVVRGRRAILLSPGCASFDQFTSYSHRGKRFCELVEPYLPIQPNANQGREL